MIDARVRNAIANEGPATFVTTGEGGPHLVATWQSYLEIIDDTTIAFPAGGYRVTEKNLAGGSSVQMVLGSKGGDAGSGLGMRLTGTAALQTGTPIFDRVKARFPWCRAAVVFTVTKVEKILGQ